MFLLKNPLFNIPFTKITCPDQSFKSHKTNSTIFFKRLFLCSKFTNSYLSSCCICQNWVFHRSRHVLYIPDQSLLIFSDRADVTWRMWSPWDSIDWGRVILKSCHRNGRDSDVNDKDFGAILSESGQVVVIMLIECQSEKRVSVRFFKDNHWIFHMANVEHSNGPVCAHTSKHIFATVNFREGNVKYFSVMSNKLSLYITFSGFALSDWFTGLKRLQ